LLGREMNFHESTISESLRPLQHRVR
jgi:hypothetical protein